MWSRSARAQQGPPTPLDLEGQGGEGQRRNGGRRVLLGACIDARTIQVRPIPGERGRTGAQERGADQGVAPSSPRCPPGAAERCGKVVHRFKGGGTTSFHPSRLISPSWPSQPHHTLSIYVWVVCWPTRRPIAALSHPKPPQTVSDSFQPQHPPLLFLANVGVCPRHRADASQWTRPRGSSSRGGRP